MRLVRRYAYNSIWNRSAQLKWCAAPNKAAKRDPYEVLGINKNASQGDIKKAYYAVIYWMKMINMTRVTRNILY